MANRIVLNGVSYHGKGAISVIADEAKAHGVKKAFVCSDPDLIKFGVTKKVTAVLDGAGLAHETYPNIKPNPTIEKRTDRRSRLQGQRRRLHHRHRRRAPWIPLRPSA